MLEKIGTYLREGNTYSSLEIFEREGEEQYSLLQVRRDKGELFVVGSDTSDRLESLKRHFGKNVPVFLVVNTSNVLTKQIASLDSSAPEAIVNHVFPNLNLDSFYYEIIQEETYPTVAISKKDYINGILDRLKGLGFSVAKFRLGVSPIVPILSYLEGDKIVISNAVLTLEDRSVREIRPKQELDRQKYNVNGIGLSSLFLLPFAQILGHLEGRPSLSNFDDLNNTLVSDLGNKRIFDKVSKVAVVFFLGLLLVNYFVFDYYRNASERQKADLKTSASQRTTLKNLELSVRSKQERLEMLSASSNSRSTYYLDRFAKDVPTTILLDKIAYQPLRKPIRDTKPVEVETYSIVVSGISENSARFSRWLEKLEERPWTASVETLDYDFLNGESSSFSLKIGIHAD